MTNAEFQAKLNKLYDEFPLIGRSKQKTINELIFILRQDDEIEDYGYEEDSNSGCNNNNNNNNNNNGCGCNNKNNGCSCGCNCGCNNH